MQTNTRRRAVVAAAAAAAVALGAFGAAGAANAEPVGSPTFRSLAGVSSDTTQDLYNGLSQVITNAGGTKLLGSYNATNPTTGAVNDAITTKSGGTTFDRPNGSSQGVSALKSAKDATTVFRGKNLVSTDVQFARSSSAATWVSGGTYAYVPIALDGVTYAKNAAGAAPSNIPLGTSTGQDTDGDGILDLTLRNIYTRNATTTLEDAANTTFTVGNQASGAQIVPFKPQSGSGTLSFWTSTMGGSLGSIVSDSYTDGSGSHQVQEHDGAVTAAVTNAIVPFSIAQHIAQGNSATLLTSYTVTVADRRDGAVLGQINGVAPLASGALNTAFPVVRPVFTVVEYAELATNTNLRNTFQGATAAAYTATRPSDPSKLVIKDFGFGNLAGGVTIGSTTYNPGDTTSFRTN